MLRLAHTCIYESYATCLRPPCYCSHSSCCAYSPSFRQLFHAYIYSYLHASVRSGCCTRGLNNSMRRAHALKGEVDQSAFSGEVRAIKVQHKRGWNSLPHTTTSLRIPMRHARVGQQRAASSYTQRRSEPVSFRWRSTSDKSSTQAKRGVGIACQHTTMSSRIHILRPTATVA